MKLAQETERIKRGLRDAILLLCSNGLSYNTELDIDGLIAVTLDRHEVVVLNIKEVLKNKSGQTHSDCGKDESENEANLSHTNSQSLKKLLHKKRKAKLVNSDELTEASANASNQNVIRSSSHQSLSTLECITGEHHLPISSEIRNNTRSESSNSISNASLASNTDVPICTDQVATVPSTLPTNNAQADLAEKCDNDSARNPSDESSVPLDLVKKKEKDVCLADTGNTLKVNSIDKNTCDEATHSSNIESPAHPNADLEEDAIDQDDFSYSDNSMDMDSNAEEREAFALDASRNVKREFDDDIDDESYDDDLAEANSGGASAPLNLATGGSCGSLYGGTSNVKGVIPTTPPSAAGPGSALTMGLPPLLHMGIDSRSWLHTLASYSHGVPAAGMHVPSLFPAFGLGSTASIPASGGKLNVRRLRRLELT